MKLGSDKAKTATVMFDLTPMIDCTFQLVIFFMLTLNFSNVEQNETIRLPESELAKPQERALDSPITLQLTSQGTVLAAGDEVPVSSLRPLLMREKESLIERGKRPSAATIIIRGDAAAKSGKIQEMIEISQKVGFEKFVLRAKEKEGT